MNITSLEPVDLAIGIVIFLIVVAWASDVVMKFWEDSE